MKKMPTKIRRKTVRKLSFTCQIKDERNHVVDPIGHALIPGATHFYLMDEDEKNPPLDMLVWYEVPDESIPSGVRPLLKKLHKVGDTVTALVSADQAFGQYNADLQRKIARRDFPGKLPNDLKVGMQVKESSNGGPITVLAFNDTILFLDYNHPLAGKNLIFTIELVDVERIEKSSITRNPFMDFSLSGHEFPIVDVSEDERKSQELLPSTREAAHEAMIKHGCVLLRGCFEVDFINKLAETWHKNNPQDAAAMEAAAYKNLDDRPLSQHSIYRREAHRYEITMPMTGPFGDPALFANPLILSVLKESLGDRLQLCSFTSVVSFPGAVLQQIHRDYSILFGEDIQSVNPRDLPAHAISVSVPLLDVDMSMGPTVVWLGSHLWPSSCPIPFSIDSTSISFKKGDCMMFDYRLFHAGGPNRSDQKRPIIYMVYGREWFYDEGHNHATNNPVDLPLEQWLALDKPTQELMKRAYTQAIRSMKKT